MKFSSKVEKSGLSPMRKFHPYAVAAKARGIKVYHLNIGQPDIETPKAYFEAVRHFDLPVLEYAPSPGMPVLVEAIQKYYDKLDMHFDAGDILITNGGSEALQIAMNCILDDGDEILIPEPFYPNYNTMVRTCGASIHPIPTSPREGYRYADRARVEAEINQHTRAIVCTNPGNPTGVVLTPEEMRAYRGTLTEPGKESPYRNRSVEENLDLFMRMSKGEFPEGSKVLRAKIDMSSPNLNMRDPIIYRIMYAHHHRTGDKWCVYPMYDFAHPLSDAREGVTHSLCSLEFENHRPLYNWFVDELIEGQKPRQIEFARLNLNYTLTSKRKCLKLVQDGIVSGWDDPRMATLSGMRRRGYPPEAVRDFCERIGVSKAYSVVDFALLEACVREHLNTSAPRAMAVLDPIKLVIDNYPEDKTEALEVEYHPDHPEYGKRTVPFGRELYIERDDFMAEPIKKYRRLYPGNEVRLYKAYLVTCTGYDTDENGNVTCVHATYDPATFGGDAPDGRKVRGTIHWVSAKENTPLTARIYDRLFNVENPSDDSGVNSFEENLNPDSLTEKQGYGEVALATAKAGDRFQFMRDGYFCMDKDSAPGAPVFNRTVALRDSFNIKKNK